MNQIIITIFGLIVIGCLIRLFCKGDTSDKTFQKIIGGFTVFIVAILANNLWVFLLSLFIGGLIIASENFMVLLAAIIKSKGGTVPDTIDAMNDFIKKSTPEEVEEKNKQSIKEIRETDEIADELSKEAEEKTLESEENFIIPKADYSSILPKIETITLNKVEKGLNKKIKRQVTFSNPSISKDFFTFDGSVVDNENNFLRLFEVKIFPKLPRNKNGKVMTFAIIRSIRKFFFNLTSKLDVFLKNTSGWKNVLTIVIVLNTKTDFIRIRKRIEELSGEFNKTTQNFQVNFIFYNLKNIDLDLEED